MENTVIAVCRTTVGELLSKNGGQSIKMAPGSMNASLKVVSCVPKLTPSFTDYIKANFKISLIGAIDFTYSNGTASNPSSLHYIGNPHNQYINCLTEVTKILHQYDSDGKYPFYGFGGIPTYMGATDVSYCFPLNGNAGDAQIQGVENVIATYKQRVS